METEIKKIELDITDDRYFQAVAILVDNLRFLKLVSELKSNFMSGEISSQWYGDEGVKFKNIEISNKLTQKFGFPNYFNGVIYSAVTLGKVNDKDVSEMGKIDWLLEYKIAQKYKGTLLAGYLKQKPFETKKISNFRQAREWYWEYLPYEFGYLKMAKGDESLKETIRSAIRAYRARINY